MSPRQALASTLHLFVVLAFFTAGLFFIALPYLPETRMQMVDILSNQFDKCITIGLSLFLTALIFLFGFYALNRGRFLVIQMGVSTDLKIIRQTIEECFGKQFPKKIFLKEIEIGPKSGLEMRVHLAPLDESAREELFIRVEQELGVLLKNRFGYSKPFHLTVNQ
jgi:hypothetical protein